MYNKFKGALYLNGSGKSVLTRITFEFDCFQFLVESGDTFQAPYHTVSIGLGGYEDRMVEIKGIGINNETIVCYVDEDNKDAFLQTCSHTPSLDRFSIEKVIRKDRNFRFFQFCLDWGIFILSLFGGIIAIILYFVFI